MIRVKNYQGRVPCCGFRRAFLPATKVSPKEMLPVVDKPLIQYAVEESIVAGATEFIFITDKHKRSIEDHFDKAYELEAELVFDTSKPDGTMRKLMDVCLINTLGWQAKVTLT